MYRYGAEGFQVERDNPEQEGFCQEGTRRMPSVGKIMRALLRLCYFCTKAIAIFLSARRNAKDVRHERRLLFALKNKELLVLVSGHSKRSEHFSQVGKKRKK